MATEKKEKTCPNGHIFIKSSDCPVCPQCEKSRNANAFFIPKIPAPARRALQNNNIHSVKELAKWKKDDVLALHGMGPSSMPHLLQALEKEGLSFKA